MAIKNWEVLQLKYNNIAKDGFNQKGEVFNGFSFMYIFINSL